MDDKLPFYKGFAKDKRLAELADEANDSYCQARTAWRGALDHARRCGAALLEARRIQGGRGKWSIWVEKHFDGSRRTAREYMRIARKWNDPRVLEARAGHFKVTSIRAMLAIMSDTAPKTPAVEPDPDEEPWDQFLLKHFRNEINQKLKTLTTEELQHGSLAFAKDIWPVFRAALDHAVWAASGDDEYQEKQHGRCVANRRAVLREVITEKLYRLSSREIEITFNNFDKQMWPAWYAVVRHAMNIINDGDWYGTDDGTDRGKREPVDGFW